MGEKTRYTFPKSERLTNVKLIESVFTSTDNAKAFPLLFIYRIFELQGDTAFQVMFSVSKKKFKHAVDRNRIKRLMRESFRLQKPEFIEAIGDRKITMTLAKATAPLPKVRADREVLGRILTHLLSNAVKYNRDGGSVRVDYDTTDPDMLAIHIRDSGEGIAPELQPRVFTPFDRLGHENGTISGTGIGLAICKRLAELTGCTLTFTSQSNIGSVFTLRVPRA